MSEELSSRLPQNYVYSNGYIGLVQYLSDLTPLVTFRGEDFQVRESFKVSLVCAECAVPDLVKAHDITAEAAAMKIVDSFSRLVAQLGAPGVESFGELRLAAAEDRKAIIIMCDLPKLDNLSKQLEFDLKVSMPDQPTHVTLYTLDGRAVSLSDRYELNRLTEPITGPELEELKTAINYDYNL